MRGGKDVALFVCAGRAWGCDAVAEHSDRWSGCDMTQESKFVLLPGITVLVWDTVELKKAQKRFMHHRRVRH